MTRVCICILLLLLLRTDSYSSRAPLDSLNYLLETAETDLQRIDVLLALSRTHMLGEPPLQKGMDYAQEALALAQALGDKAQEVNASLFVSMMKRNLAINNQGEFYKLRQSALASGDPDAIAFSSYLWVEEELYASEEGIIVLEDIIEQFGSIITKKNLGNVYKCLSWQYELTGSFDKAEEANLNAIEIFRTLPRDPDILPYLGRPSAQVIDGGKGNLMQTLVYNALLYLKMGRYDDALTFGLEAYEIGLSTNVSDEAWSGMRLGAIYAELGQYNKAIELYIKSLNIYRQLNEPAWISSVLSDLGGTFLLIGDYDEAEKRILEAYEIVKDLPIDRADMLRILAGIYERKEEYDKSIDAYLEADSLYEVLDNQVLRAECQFGIANAEQRQGFSERAIQRIESQLSLLEKVKDAERLYIGYDRLSSIHRAAEQYDIAMDWAMKSLNIARLDSLDYGKLKHSHLTLSQLNENLGNYKKGLYHHKKYRDYDDKQLLESTSQSLKAEQVRQNVADYQNQKEQAEQIASILSSQSKTYLFIACLLAGLLALGSYLFVQLRKTRVLLSTQNQELQELNHTKDRFFGIIAHDLRSPLVALESVDEQMSYYVDKNNVEKVKSLSTIVGKTASNLSALLDNLLNWALLQTGQIPYNPKIIILSKTIEEVIDLLKINAEIKQISITNEGNTGVNVYADPAALQTIIRNIISNAIKFCNAHDKITITTIVQNRAVHIEIEDTGLGMTPAQVSGLFLMEKRSRKGTSGEKGTGLGLVLVKDLVELNKGQLKIESVINQGTKVIITLPTPSN